MISLILGGSGSGKSEFAEGFVLNKNMDERYYIATMQPYDMECEEKINRHRQMRKEKNFNTIECYTNIGNIKILNSNCIMLLECMSNLLANEMYSKEGRGGECVPAILNDIKTLAGQIGHLVVVSNNVFADGMVYDLETTAYIDALGKINQELAKAADHVIEVVYGIPVVIKGGTAYEESN